jgi:glutathione S-transferase
MSDKVTLGYWNIRGFAERIRLLLAYLNIDFDQIIYTPETRQDWF